MQAPCGLGPTMPRPRHGLVLGTARGRPAAPGNPGVAACAPPRALRVPLAPFPDGRLVPGSSARGPLALQGPGQHGPGQGTSGRREGVKSVFRSRPRLTPAYLGLGGVSQLSGHCTRSWESTVSCLPASPLHVQMAVAGPAEPSGQLHVRQDVPEGTPGCQLPVRGL